MIFNLEIKTDEYFKSKIIEEWGFNEINMRNLEKYRSDYGLSYKQAYNIGNRSVFETCDKLERLYRGDDINA